jgi:CheY-like chemotaxis protein
MRPPFTALLLGTATPRELPLRLDGVRVLVVDDDEDSRVVVAAMLESAGAVVAMAASARAAFDALAPSSPDVLISDIAMAEEDGYSLVRRIRALPARHRAALPAIALTAYADPPDHDAALAAGFHEHLAKPVEPAMLVATVTRLLRGALPSGSAM